MMTHAARNGQALAAPGGAPPYKTAEAVALLGVSQDAIENHYRDLGGTKIGARVVIPRARVDELCGIPAPDPTPAVERVLALVPLLDWRECGRVIAAAARHLAEQQRPAL